jgi:hypothetical protein
VADDTKRLLLTVEVLSRTLTLELRPGSELSLGRSEKADITIDESSVSSEHLKVIFSGKMLKIKDLDSLNGTFRMPNEAPFAEAEFSLTSQSLLLRVGLSAELKLSWQLKADSKSPELTKTALETSAPNNTSVGSVKPKKPEEMGSGVSPVPKPASIAPSIAGTSEVVARVRKQTSSYFRVFALLVYSALVLALSKALWLNELGFVDRITKSQRGVGLGIDILAVSLSGYALRGWLVSTLCLLLAYGFYRFWIKHLQSFKLRAAIGAWAVVISVWPLVYPFVLAARNGVGMKHLNALRSSQEILQTSKYTIEEKSQKFAELLPHLEGSSFFYSKVVNLFFEKVVDECGGAWKDDWNKKKLCLVLINSVTVEALSDMKPQVMQPIALRLVLLTSLDSIMRIFPVEGPASEMNIVFIKSVEAIGLKDEADRIRSIVTSPKTSAAEKLDSLQKLKLSVEMRLESLNVELSLPEVMRVKPPDILALGI